MSAGDPHLLDARGLICPLPVLKARKRLMALPPGGTLRVLVTGAQAPQDFQLFCAESGHSLSSVADRGDGVTEIVITARQAGEKA